MAKPTRLLIDGNNLVHRAHHAHWGLTDPKGKPTSAVYGVLSTLVRLEQIFTPDVVVVLFDTIAPVWRKALLPEYKQQRRERLLASSEEQQDQARQLREIEFPRVLRTLQRFAVPCVSVEGLEADDLIALITSENDGTYDDVIVSSDRDLWQLCKRYRTRVFDTHAEAMVYINKRGQLKHAQRGVIAASSRAFTLQRAFIGDVGDNIKGVHGIGEVRAAKIVDDAPLPNESTMQYLKRKETNLLALKAARDPNDSSKVNNEVYAIIKKNLQLISLGNPTWLNSIMLGLHTQGAIDEFIIQNDSRSYMRIIYNECQQQCEMLADERITHAAYLIQRTHKQRALTPCETIFRMWGFQWAFSPVMCEAMQSTFITWRNRAHATYKTKSIQLKRTKT